MRRVWATATGAGSFASGLSRTFAGGGEGRAVSVRKRKRNGRKLNRRLAVAALVLMGFLYWKPIHSYLHVRGEVAQRQSEVRSLAAQKRTLLQRLSFSTSTD